MTRAALYARVSTADQRSDGQLYALRAHSEARGFEVVAELVDNGVSGTKANRPALDELLAAAKRRDIDVVVCTKLDRLARSVRHLVNLTGELEALGVDLIVLDQGLDTSTPAGRLLFHVLGAIAEFEGDLIRERTRAGLSAARRRGKMIGRPRAMDTRMTNRASRLRASGHSLRSIASMLDVSKDTIARALGTQGVEPRRSP